MLKKTQIKGDKCIIMNKQSQKERVYDFMLNGNKVNRANALSVLKIANLTAVMSEIKKEGHPFLKETCKSYSEENGHSTYTNYYLSESEIIANGNFTERA